jgi:hypothetical protein
MVHYQDFSIKPNGVITSFISLTANRNRDEWQQAKWHCRRGSSTSLWCAAMHIERVRISTGKQ